MAWNLNDAAKIALLHKQPSVQAKLVADTISFGDGDGTGGTDTINDSGSGLGIFSVDDHILIINGTNNNKMVKVQTAAAGTIEVVAGSFVAESAGTAICLVKISTGSFSQVFKNGVIDIRTGVRPTSANDTEAGTLLLKLTKNGGAFVAGASANGINVGALTGTTLSRAIDPVTGLPEIIRGLGLVTATAGHARWYANDYTTGASTSTPRMDGVVAASGGDVNLTTGTTITTGVASEVTSLSLTMTGV